jgi:hypothetical protein
MNTIELSGIVAEYPGEGLSRQQIAERLNQRGLRTVYGNLWTPTSLNHIWPRAKKILEIKNA